MNVSFNYINSKISKNDTALKSYALPISASQSVDENGIMFNGLTICKIKDENGKILSKGIAMVSTKDQYVKSKGRKVSLKRAMENLKLSKDQRKALWQQQLKREKINV